MKKACSYYGLLLAVGMFWGALFPHTAEAQAYRFSVPDMKMQVHVWPDASVRIEYEITFQNDRTGRPIDAVDIGLFHGDYDISGMTAFIDGRPLPRIRPSPYVSPGVEIQLGGNAIRPGGSGVFRFTASMPNMVYQDTTRDDYASLRVTPTWFGSQFVVGTTNLQVAVHMPPEVDAEDLLYQDVPFSQTALYDGRAVAYWSFPTTRIIGPHMVGVSFPKEGMERVVKMTRWDLLVLWWEGNETAQMVSGAILIALFAFFFFRLTAWTGWSVFIVMIGLAGWWFYVNPVAHLMSLPFWPFVFGLMHYATRQGRGKQRYLPPIASVEGGGLKRGLTAPEAAVLLEMPIGRVVTLVVFGLLKKGVLKMEKEQPLTVTVEDEFSVDRSVRLVRASEKGIVLHAYEHPFIDAIKESAQIAQKGGTPLSEIGLSDAIKNLIEHTVERLEGFDIEETKRYYQHIIKRAWSEAESLGEVEQRTKAIDKNLEWMLMQDDYHEGFGRWETRGYTYYPIWIGGRRRHSGFGGASSSSGLGSIGRAGGASAGSSSSFTPSFKDVSGSFAGWTENVTGQVASSIMPSSVGGKSGVLDLSGFDRVTSDVFSALAESGGGMGGGGSCAGCACACACAGGGR